LERYGVPAFGHDEAEEKGHDEGVEHCRVFSASVLPVVSSGHDCLHAIRAIVSSVHAFRSNRPSRGLFRGRSSRIGDGGYDHYLILEPAGLLKKRSAARARRSRASRASCLTIRFCCQMHCGIVWHLCSRRYRNMSAARKSALDPPWIDRLMIPIGLFLYSSLVWAAFAMAPHVNGSLRRNFHVAGYCSCKCCQRFLIAAGIRHVYALISLGFFIFCPAVTIISNSSKGLTADAAKTQMNFAHAVSN
jgi:hypothetical protein